MVVALQFLSPGAANPDTATPNGREYNFTVLQDAINALILAGITGGDVFGYSSYSSAIDLTPAAITSLNNVNFTTSGRTFTLPDASDTGTGIYEGLPFIFYNTGSHAFDIDDNAGGLVYNLPAGYAVNIICTSDATAAGSWKYFEMLDGFEGVLAAVTGTANTFTKAQRMVTGTLTDATTISWDMANIQGATVTVTANRTFGAPTNLVAGQTGYLKIIQDGTGGWTTPTWNSVFKFTNGADATLSSAAGAVDIFTYICDGTNVYIAPFGFAMA